jgi:nucleotide-binding universal stress UspA family protein
MTTGGLRKGLSALLGERPGDQAEDIREETNMTIFPTEKAPRIVVGVDGSPESRQALRWAARIAGPAGARLEAVNAWDYPATYGWAAWPAGWEPARDAHNALTGIVDEVFTQNPPKDLELIVREGGAARVLLEQAKGAMMLIVGSRGHGGFAGLLLGSVSANVAEHADCPVLVVHGDTLPPEVAS